MSPVSPANKPDFHKLWLALPLAVYVLLPTRNYYWDGMSFAINAEKPLALRELFYPTHLIYTVVFTWLYRALTAIGIHTRALYLMQFCNMLMAFGSVALVYRALRRRIEDDGAAIAGALLFAFSATWWRFATDANAYIPSVFLVLAALDLIETQRSAVLAGLAHAGAMLFHELAILFLPIALWRLKDRRQAPRYLAAALAPVAASYALAYHAVSGNFSPQGFFQWVVAAPPVGVGQFSFQPLRNLGWMFLGTLRLLLGGKLGDLKLTPPPVIPAAAVAILTLALVWRFRRTGALRWKKPSKDLLVWLALYVAFLFFWMPQNTFYRMFYLAPLVLLVCGIVPRLGLLCAAFFLWNGLFLIYPQSRIENNAPLRFALAQQNRWPPCTPIAFHVFHPDLWFISYFNPQVSWIGVYPLDLGVLDRAVADARLGKQPLWLEADLYDALVAKPEGRAWIEAHPVASLLRFRETKHEFRFYQLQ